MFVVIFGRPGCPYCVRAVELSEKLAAQRGHASTCTAHVWPKHDTIL